jgi:hypothetical protein
MGVVQTRKTESWRKTYTTHTDTASYRRCVWRVDQLHTARYIQYARNLQQTYTQPRTQALTFARPPADLYHVMQLFQQLVTRMHCLFPACWKVVNGLLAFAATARLLTEETCYKLCLNNSLFVLQFNNLVTTCLLQSCKHQIFKAFFFLTRALWCKMPPKWVIPIFGWCLMTKMSLA